MAFNMLYVLCFITFLCLISNCKSDDADEVSGLSGLLAPLPKPECNYETPVQCPLNLKALGDRCLSNTECISPGVCRNGTCQCPGQLLEFDGQCVRAPSLDENCINEKCLAPYVCFRGRCDCASNMKRDGARCKLECKEGEIETLTGCVTVAKLGAPCESNLQCHTAFSYCFEGKCHCSEGTKAAGESCAAVFNCPDGQLPVKSAKGDFEKCVSFYCPSSPQNVVVQKVKLDSCPDKSYCVIPSYQDSEGFCCPEKLYCPVGEALVDKKCQSPDNANEVCPSETHYCYAGLRGVACCPLPCPSIPGKLTVVFQEKCYTKKDVGDNCQVTAQCRYNSECINSTCQCPDGFVTQFVDNEMRCRKICQPDEILAGHDCLDIVAPGQECKVSTQCTGGTRCKDGKCQCPCNRPMYNGVCVEEQLCPNFGYGVVDPQVNQKKQLVECIPNSQKFGACSTGYYCNPGQAVYAGGICCPLPEPMCANRKRPAKDKNGNYTTCSDRFPNCPRGEQCKDYVKEKLPWMPNFSVDGVCCSMFLADNEEISRPSQQLSEFSDASCPAGHKLERDQSGQTKFCNFQNYANECGSSACFRVPNTNVSPLLAVAPAKSGLCCKWSG